MPTLITDMAVKCPRDKKKVDAKIECEGPPRCPLFKHFAYRATRVYVVCDFGEPPRREEAVLEEPSDPELDQMEEEVPDGE